MKTSLGGNRLGAGGKRDVYLHDFNYSTFNLSKNFKSSMAPGVLTPCYYNLLQAGDIFDIDVKECIIRTEPTTGALFDSFKYQVDFFAVPVRLYNALLHANPVQLTTKMNEIMFPVVTLESAMKNPKKTTEDINQSQISSSSLLAYTGLRGLGLPYWTDQSEEETKNVSKVVNAMYILAYYDIFKNFYANTQENNAYVIRGGDDEQVVLPISLTTRVGSTLGELKFTDLQVTTENDKTTIELESGNAFAGSNSKYFGIEFNTESGIDFSTMTFDIVISGQSLQKTYDEFIEGHFSNGRFTTFMIKEEYFTGDPTQIYMGFVSITWKKATYYGNSTLSPTLAAFPLKNIDDMKLYLFKNSEMGVGVAINDKDILPYKAVYEQDTGGYLRSKQKMVGLCVKTYQADIFNNWLNRTEIENINAMTKIDASSGEFTIDALNLAYKIYNTLNRVQVAGTTYEDWQQAIYGIDGVRRAETPIYCGGYQSEIAFDEVISNADTEVNGELQPLGTIATRGSQQGSKGGRIKFKAAEACIILGIASITPRVNYSQGNHFSLDLLSIDDIHKPTLDRIGYEDLILERAAWFGRSKSNQNVYQQLSGGKNPAWSHYQTEVNETFGDFAAGGSLSYMCLNREYEANPQNWQRPIGDWTTYIDPSKYNYVWANSRLDAQNFWVMMHMDVKGRRKMSANPIPNL